MSANLLPGKAGPQPLVAFSPCCDAELVIGVRLIVNDYECYCPACYDADYSEEKGFTSASTVGTGKTPWEALDAYAEALDRTAEELLQRQSDHEPATLGYHCAACDTDHASREHVCEPEPPRLPPPPPKPFVKRWDPIAGLWVHCIVENGKAWCPKSGTYTAVKEGEVAA